MAIAEMAVTSGADFQDRAIEQRLYGLLLRGSGMATPGEVVGHLTAMQAQDHTYARWSVAQRMAGAPGASAVDAAFDEGHFLRTHILRPTWHYVAAGDLRWLMRLSGPRVDAATTRQYESAGLDARTLGQANEVVHWSVAEGPRMRREILADLDQQGISTAGLRSTLILMHAELTGVVCSGPKRGKQHTYAAFDQRVGTGRGPEGEEALAELAWRYFLTRGPATVRDFLWWAGLNSADARAGLESARPRLISHDVDGLTFWFAEQNVPRPGKPRVDLVQCYDEMVISYGQTRSLMQPENTKFPFLSRVDGFYNVLLLDGKLLGHWRAPSGTAAVEVRTDKVLDKRERTSLNEAIERYRKFAV
jgi:Winged helix DNA-binding domain